MALTEEQIQQILATIRTRESGGNYGAENPSSSASGAYQFIDSTWGNYGGYAHAADAPPAVQDAKARANILNIYAKYGTIEAIPAAWYVGHYDPNNLDYVPAGGNSLSVRQYIDAWMKTYTGGTYSSVSNVQAGAQDGGFNPPAATDTLGSRLNAIMGMITGHPDTGGLLSAPGFDPLVLHPGATPTSIESHPAVAPPPNYVGTPDPLTGPR